MELQNSLAIGYEEAKALLIKNEGDIAKVIESFLYDFKYNKEE